MCVLSHTQVTEDHATFESQLDAIKRRSAGHAKDKLLHEKKMKKLQADRDKKVRVCMRVCMCFLCARTTNMYVELAATYALRT